MHDFVVLHLNRAAVVAVVIDLDTELVVFGSVDIAVVVVNG